MHDVAAPLEALLSKLIDYAGLYPPAALPLTEVVANYQAYLASPQRWILNRLVLPAAKLPDVKLGADWRVTLLVENEPGPLPAQVETLETKGARALSLPTYCEAPLDQITGAFAKIRTATPDSEGLASFLHQAAARRLPFKATAGLHHPIRSADMLGFVNVFVAAAFAWYGADRFLLIEVLDESRADAFQFLDGELRWRGHSLSAEQLRTARRDFAHSFGSCSFEEPLAGLRELGWLA